MSKTLYHVLPRLLVDGALLLAIFELVPLYGLAMSGLFDHISDALILARMVA